MSYPGAKIIGYTTHHEDENMTLKSEKLTSSVVAFLPRLTSGASISIDTSISRQTVMRSDNNILPLGDYTNDLGSYQSPHIEPYSVIATYDQGSSKYSPPVLQFGTKSLYFNTGVMKTLILILLAFLFFAIPMRHKRRSRSKFASDILTDIVSLQNELKDKANNDPSVTILYLHTWQPNIDTGRQIND
jgi:hypothetical protein